MSNSKFYAQVVEDPATNECFLSFPQEMIKELDWQENDRLEWKQVGNDFIINNISAEQRKK